MTLETIAPIVPSASSALGAMAILFLAALFSPSAERGGWRLGRNRARHRPGAGPSRRAEAEQDAELARMRINLLLAAVATAALAVAASVAAVHFGSRSAPGSMFPMLGHDDLSLVSILIVGGAAALVIWLSTSRLTSIRVPYGEYYALVLLGLAGGFAALQAENTMVLFLGLEVMGVSASVLIAVERGKEHGLEAAFKAFLSNVVAAGILLFGIFFLFGATGHFDYAGLRGTLDPEQPIALAGLALVFAGLAMKLALAPFHQWLPDVLEGSSTSIGAYFSVCVVVTVVLSWLRFVLHALPEHGSLMAPAFAALGVASIAIGNAMGLAQRNVKRMLGWLVVAQVGTWMLLFAVGGPGAYGALLFYLLAYALVMVGSFGVLMTLKGGGREMERLEHFAGIAESRKGLAAIMTLFMLALAGAPGTVGFWARWQLVDALVAAGQLWLAVVALLGTVVSFYICMRVPVMMYMRESPEEQPTESSTTELAVLLLCAGVILGLGFWPDPVLPGGGMRLFEFLRLSAH